MTKNELQNYINKQLFSVNNKLGNHILNVRQIPNPMYMVEPNQSEMKWSDDYNEIYSKLEDYREYLLKFLNK